MRGPSFLLAVACRFWRARPGYAAEGNARSAQAAAPAAIAFSLAVGVTCDALVVRMTAVPTVPAVLPLTRTWACRLPSWLSRALPNLDIEGATACRSARG
jgi:hypothetical protein